MFEDPAVASFGLMMMDQQNAAGVYLTTMEAAAPTSGTVTQEALAAAKLELGGNPNALTLRRPFDPVAHDLDANFRLTRFADLKG